YNESFPPGDPVAFDDTPAGATHPVNITTVVSPAVVIVNNTEPYAFIGTGHISGPSGLIKNGSGTLEIANGAINDYTGATTISGGTLRMNGALQNSSQVVIENGATLCGTGTITAPVTIANTAILAAGNGVGTLTINNNLTLSPGSSNVFEVNSDSLG